MTLSSFHVPHLRPLPLRFLLVLLGLLLLTVTAAVTAQTLVTDLGIDAPAGPIRLRQVAPQPGIEERSATTVAPPSPSASGEFERFVQRQAGPGIEIRRLGADLMSGAFDGRGADLSPLVPSDYVIGPGDEILLTIWGSVDSDLRLLVDRGGRISIPRVGPVQVSGVRSGDLEDVITRRVGQVFKNYQLSASLGQLRGIRVFVTGFAAKPGAYTVNSLSTALTALMRAGGPAASGSFRNIEIRRQGALLGTFDLYDLLLKGDRAADRVLQAGDVIFIGPVGIQIGFIGSVNRPVVMEIKAGETVADALRIAGGFSAVADRSRLAVERLRDRAATHVAQLELPADLPQPLSHGDMLRAFSAVDIAFPTQGRSKRVRIEGEVLRPAEYVLPESSSVEDALRAAGGFTPAAFVFATEFTRVSVQQTQQQNYERALRDLETSLARQSTSRRVSTAEEATAATARTASNLQLLERLRQLRPTGRVVLQLEPRSRKLPDLALEDGDRIYVPARPTAVGVFGSVYNAGSYHYLPDKRLDEYLWLAGGPPKGADDDGVFMVRANGAVISSRQRSSGWFNRGGGLGAVPAEPGDTIFVPEELNQTTFMQNLRDWVRSCRSSGWGWRRSRCWGTRRSVAMREHAPLPGRAGPAQRQYWGRRARLDLTE